MSRTDEAEYTTATTVAEHNTIQTELSIATPPAEGPRPRHWALNVIGVAVVLGICYYAESLLVVLLFSIHLSFVLAPVVHLLTRVHLPRALASGIAVLLLLGLAGGGVNFSSNQAANLAEDLPKYTG